MSSVLIDSLLQPLKGSSYKTNWPLLLLIFLMPLRNIQLQYLPNLGGGLNAINILFLLALIHSLANGRTYKAKVGFNTLLIWYIASSVVALFVGYVFLGDGASGNWNAMKDQLIPVFMVFIVQRSAADIVQWRRIFVAVLLPLPYCFKVVLNQYRSVSSWHYSHDLRISGTFMDLGANEMGAYSLMLALVCLACMITCWHLKRWRAVFAVAFIFAGCSLLYSYSRGGYISFLLGAIIIFFLYKNTGKLLVPAILFAMIGLANLPASVEERFSSISAEDEERDESAQSRFVFWEVAMERFYESPVIGYGYRTVQDPRINPHQMDPHNYYVKMFVERGVIGFITFLLLLNAFWRLSRRNLDWNDDPMSAGLMLGISGAIWALALGNMFGDRFSHYPIATSLWVMCALISTKELWKKELLREKRKNSLANK